MSQRITTSFPDIRKFTYTTTNKLENELETGELGKISGLLLAFFVLGRLIRGTQKLNRGLLGGNEEKHGPVRDF